MNCYSFIRLERLLFLSLAVWMGSSASCRAQAGDYTWSSIAGLAGASGSADGTSSGARFTWPLTNGIAVSGENYVLTNATGAAAAFFRLRKQ